MNPLRFWVSGKVSGLFPLSVRTSKILYWHFQNLCNLISFQKPLQGSNNPGKKRINPKPRRSRLNDGKMLKNLDSIARYTYFLTRLP